MDYGMFEEALVDFFARQHHDVAVARSRAAAIVRIAKGCDEEHVGIVLDCSPLNLVADLIVEEAGFQEGTLAVETVTRFNQRRRRKLVIDFNDPSLQGGGWLQPLRDAAEKIRRDAVKAARKSNQPKKKETK
jgi:hypothetical protein